MVLLLIDNKTVLQQALCCIYGSVLFSGESNKTQRFSAIKLLGQKTDNVERLEQGIKQAVLLVFPHEDNYSRVKNG